ncbi:MAG TPA: FG-GAP-like repeat-containing protein, partial [Polyangiaceae bacterium]|nr:FG-GAP-like repeat-containing protein [Polyangiaceae bacterium]
MKTLSSASVSLLCIVLGAGCAEIKPIAEDQCGNSVIDEGEDCDRVSHLGMSCRPPEAEGACRFDCSSGEPCAPGFACGQDGICRAPSGGLEEMATIGDGADLILPGDFDADGVMDLLASSKGNLSLSYLGPDFEEEDTVDLFFAFDNVPLAAGQLTDDSAADIAFADLSGVDVARGSDERQLFSTVYPTYSVPAPHAVIFGADADPTLAGSEGLSVVDSPGIGAILLIIAISLDARPTYYLTDPGFLPAFSDDALELANIPAAVLDPSKPCEQYVLAYRKQVFIGTPCLTSGAINGQVFDPVTLDTPPPVPIPPLTVDFTNCPIDVDRAFIVDVDADGNLDVVLSPRPSTEATPCVVRGPLTFPEDSSAPTVAAESYPLFSTLPPMLETSGSTERVLSIAELNSDGVPDLVTSYGIFLSQNTPCPQNLLDHSGLLSGVYHCATVFSAGKTSDDDFVSAAVGDANGDGVPDVALSSGQSGKVLVYGGHADGTYAEYSLEAEGYAGELTLADLDGDGLDDLAFADRSCNAAGECVKSDTSDILSVAFGRITGGPEEARGLGRPGSIEHLEVTQFTSLFGVLDATKDLGVLSRDPEDQSLNFAILQGSTRRQLQAPFFLFIPGSFATESSEIFDPVSLALGRFVDRDPSGASVPTIATSGEHRDIAVAAFSTADASLSPPTRLWLLDSEGEAELALSRTWPSAPVGAWQDHHPRYSALAAADLDGDPADELVYASGRGLAIANVELTTEADGSS